MQVTYEVGSYNSRRYGKPWLAVVTDWPVGAYPTLAFGANIDNYTCEIDARPGTLVKYGQKDHRGSGTTNQFGIVQRDGSIASTTPGAARKHFLAGCPVPPEPEPETEAQTEMEGENVVPFKAAGEGA